MTGAIIRRTLAIGTLALGLALVAVPASAQSGQIKGKVVDAKGQPIRGCKGHDCKYRDLRPPAGNEDQQKG